MPSRIPRPSDSTRAVSEEVADLLHSVTRRARVAVNEDLGPLGVTWAQVRALRTLARRGEPIHMSALADHLGIARRSTTSVVDDLAERGLVARRADPHDRRAIAVEVTAAGTSLLAELDQRRRAASARVTATLTSTELVTLRDLLRRLDAA